MRRLAPAGALAWFLAAGAVPAAAQDFETIAPRQPDPAPPGALAEPAPLPEAQPAAEDPLLIDELRGLVFVSRVEAIARGGSDATGITVADDLPLLGDPGLRDALAAFLGRPLRAADLERISDLVSDWYRARHLPIVDVTFPEQDVSHGTVQAVVTLYRLGAVHVEGARHFDPDVMTRRMRLRPGAPIAFDALRQDLNRLNRNPFRSVDAVLARSDVPGNTDLVLRVDDRLPLRLYAAYDNDGLPATGRRRYSAGLNWGNAFGVDHRLSYQLLFTPRLDSAAGDSDDHTRFLAHSASYVAPLASGDFLTLFGAYAQSVPDVGPFFDQVGHSVQLGARYERPLRPWGALSHSLEFGFDYKRSDNNLAFGGTQIYASATTIAQFVLGYSATLPDSTGQTAVENRLVISPGGLVAGNNTAAFLASGTAGASARYVYDNLSITRVNRLPAQFSAYLRAEVQLANRELLPMEQLGAGGPGSVRGYDPRAASGSQGILASAELRSPPLRPLSRLIGTEPGDRLQALAFYDLGFVAHKHAQQGQPARRTLQSMGLGLRYGIGRNLSLRLDHGWQLADPPGADRRGSRTSLSLSLSY